MKSIFGNVSICEKRAVEFVSCFNKSSIEVRIINIPGIEVQSFLHSAENPRTLDMLTSGFVISPFLPAKYLCKNQERLDFRISCVSWFQSPTLKPLLVLFAIFGQPHTNVSSPFLHCNLSRRQFLSANSPRNASW